MGEAGQATETAGKKMSTFAKVAVAALAVKALGAVKTFVADSHQAFVNLNESLNAVEVTFGDSADGIKKLGKEAANNLGLSNAEFNTFAVSIANFAKKIAGEGGDVVGTVDELTTRISDFASVMNLEVNVAAEKFQSGLAGQSRPLREFGIDVSDAAVKTFALANGIGDASGELTEGEKVQARYGAIMEQTANVAGDFTNTIDEYANAQRVANAEAENAKAAIGQGLDAAFKAALPFISQAAKGIGIIALSLQDLTGQLSPAETAVQQFELQMGLVADTAQAALTIQKEWGVSLSDLLPIMGLSIDELGRLRDADEEFLLSMGFTEEQVREVAETVDKEFGAAISRSADKVQRAKGPVDDLASGFEDLGEETEETTSALQRFEDEVRSQTDPLFNLVNKTNDLADAQDAVTAAVTEYGQGSLEHRDALRNEFLAWEDLKAAQLRVAEQSGFTKEEFIANLRATGQFTQDEINLIIADFERVNAFKFSDKTIRVNEILGTQVSSNIGGRQHGGPVKRGTPYVVGEDGPELMVPDQSGTIIPNGSNGGSALGGTAIYLTVQGTVITPTDLIDAIHEGLLQKQKRSGGLGLAG